MTKKDRIAVVISVVLLLLSALLIVPMGDGAGLGIVFLFAVVIYWGYRFIKNDISFLKMRDD